MKKITSLFTTCFLLAGTLVCAQTRVPEPKDEPAGSGAHYYSNLGQIADESGNPHPEILYYTEQGSPLIYLTDRGAHFIAHRQGADTTAPDTLNRITMEFKCESYPDIPCGNIATYEPGVDTLNYYQPHCASGITGVTGVAGVVYQNIVANTDFHFYSNAYGMKNFVRFRPGSSPSTFILKFSGQDSIVALGSIVALFVDGYAFTLPVADAYEVDAFNNVYPLPWTPTWASYGNGEIGLMTGPYNPGRDLVVRIGVINTLRTAAVDNLYWSTYYGTGPQGEFGMQGPSKETTPVICANTNDDVFHAMAISAGIFPTKSSLTLFNKLTDCYVSKFEKNMNPSIAALGAPVRTWATYFGGNGIDKPWAIAERDRTSSTGELYVAGYSESSTLPTLPTSSPAFHQVSGNGGADGFIVSFNKMNGNLQYSTFFGGDGYDEITCLAPDPATNTLYFGGSTSSETTSTSCSSPASTDFSLCAGGGGRYFQSALGQTGSPDGFVASLNMNTKALTWSTYFGGYHDEEVRTIAVSDAGGRHSVFVGGTTNSGASVKSGDWASPMTTPPVSAFGVTLFPLCDPGGGAYFQNVGAEGSNEEGFLARFDNNHRLAWCTYFGGNKSDVLWKIGVTGPGELYATGVTITDNANSQPTTRNWANNNGEFPIYYTGGAYNQSFASSGSVTPTSNAFIARFSASQSLSWCSYFGGSGGAFEAGNPESLTCDLAIDPAGGVYMSGFSKLDNAASSGSNIPVCATCSPAGKYSQAQNASTGRAADESTYDGWIVQFNGGNYPVWTTNFGGQVKSQGMISSVPGNPRDPNADERINAIALGGGSGSTTLYITGVTRCDNSPRVDFDPGSKNDYFQGSYSGDGDVFIGRFNPANTSLGAGSSPGYPGSPNLRVRPNPSSGMFDVRYRSTSGDAEARARVLNGLGQLVETAMSRIDNGQAKFILNLSALPAGLYILNVNGESTTLIKK